MVAPNSQSISQVSPRRVSQLLNGELSQLERASSNGEFGVWGEVVSVDKDHRSVYCQLRDKEELAGLQVRLPLETTLAIGSYVRVVGRVEVSTDRANGTARLVLCGALDQTRSSNRLAELEASIARLRGEYTPRALPASSLKKIGVVSGSLSKARKDFASALGGVVAVSTTTARLSSPADIARAIEKAGQEDVDLLVVTRGGGDVMSLAVFDEPAVLEVLAHVSATVPVILAIGHASDEQKAARLVSHTSATPSAAGALVRRLFYKNRPSGGAKNNTDETAPSAIDDSQAVPNRTRVAWLRPASFLAIGFLLGLLAAYGVAR